MNTNKSRALSIAPRAILAQRQARCVAARYGLRSTTLGGRVAFVTAPNAGAFSKGAVAPLAAAFRAAGCACDVCVVDATGAPRSARSHRGLPALKAGRPLTPKVGRLFFIYC